MTKSDNFFDISGTAEASATPAAGKHAEVDFDVFGNAEAPVAGVDEVDDFSATALLPNAVPTGNVDFELDDDSPAATPAASSARTSPPVTTVPTDAAPALGGGKLWIGIAAAVIVAVVVYWFLYG